MSRDPIIVHIDNESGIAIYGPGEFSAWFPTQDSCNYVIEFEVL